MTWQVLPMVRYACVVTRLMHLEVRCAILLTSIVPVLVMVDWTLYSSGLGSWCSAPCPGDSEQGCGGNRLVRITSSCMMYHVLQHWYPGFC